jgi:hypothetical protein
MREQIGTVNILEPRLYPRYPAKPPRLEITTADELVNVEDGWWPVYRDDDGLIYWEMEGELVRIENTFNSLGDGMFMARQELRALRERVIFRSMTYTAKEFAEFRASDPLVTGDDSVRRLVFKVTL